MTPLKSNEVAAHEWLAMPFMAIGFVVILLCSTFQRGDGFSQWVSVIAVGYPIVAELSLRYGATSHVVYCYVAWLALAPLFFVIAFYSTAFRRLLEKDGHSPFRVVGLITVTMALILFFPPDPSNTGTSDRWENLLFINELTVTISSGVLTCGIANLAAYSVVAVSGFVNHRMRARP